MPKPIYPFVPKSNRRLQPGQFFSIPLSTGRYAAGRVMLATNIPTEHRTLVVNGLLDWSGDEPPTYDDLAGCALIDQAISGFQAITNNGGVILGERPLDLDGLRPMEFTPRAGEVTTVWGWKVLKWLAEELFGSGEPWRDAARRSADSE